MEGNGSTPATRADLDLMEKRIVEQVGERLHDTETRLLRAFFQYQEHTDVRMRKMAADISNMDTASDLRLNNLERRVIELERKMIEDGRRKPWPCEQASGNLRPGLRGSVANFMATSD